MRALGVKTVLAGLFSLVAIGCGGGAILRSTELASSGGWVIVVFMSADNELEAQAIADINEMEAAGLLDTGVSVVVLLDRAAGHDDSNGDWSGARVYEITDDPDGIDGEISSVELAVPALGTGVDSAGAELNTGDPRTLAALLDFVAERYRPDRTAVVIWGHGGGYASTGYDESGGGDVLHTAELSAALAGRGLDLIGFDTDFAATIEVAWELRETA
ncbi:MAG: clostripain-related cysteine peptidase, partial [Spirochaetota bacterium]